MTPGPRRGLEQRGGGGLLTAPPPLPLRKAPQAHLLPPTTQPETSLNPPPPPHALPAADAPALLTVSRATPYCGQAVSSGGQNHTVSAEAARRPEAGGSHRGSRGVLVTTVTLHN